MANASATASSELLKQAQTSKHRTLFQDAMRRFFRNRLAVFGLAANLVAARWKDGHFAHAIDLLDALCVSDNFDTFLTLEAYRKI